MITCKDLIDRIVLISFCVPAILQTVHSQASHQWWKRICSTMIQFDAAINTEEAAAAAHTHGLQCLKVSHHSGWQSLCRLMSWDSAVCAAEATVYPRQWNVWHGGGDIHIVSGSSNYLFFFTFTWATKLPLSSGSTSSRRHMQCVGHSRIQLLAHLLYFTC